MMFVRSEIKGLGDLKKLRLAIENMSCCNVKVYFRQFIPFLYRIWYNEEVFCVGRIKGAWIIKKNYM